MLELKAQVIVSDQERFRQSDGSTRFKDRILERMARELAERLMATPGAVEIEESVNPQTGDLRVRARVIVANREADWRGRMTATEVRFGGRREGKTTAYKEQLNALEEARASALMDAMKYGTSPMMYFSDASGPTRLNESLTFEQVEKARAAMDSALYDPLFFLKTRIDRKEAKDQAVVESMEKIKAGQAVKKAIGKPGKAVSAVTVTVRKIQMPNE